VIVCFVDIDGIVNHHCVNFLFIILTDLISIEIIGFRGKPG